MSRVPSPESRVPTSHAEADQLLRRDCEIEAALEQIEGRLQEQVTHAKAIADGQSGRLLKERGILRTQLKQWFRAWRKLNPGSVYRCLFGRIVARPKRAISFIAGISEEEAVGALVSAGLSEFVRVKKELNRAAIHDAPAEIKDRIAALGVVFDPGENVSIEPDKEALVSEPRA